MQFFRHLAVAAIIIATTSLSLAQTYPTKPIRFLANLPGGAPEAIQRAVLDKVRENTGATLLFEQRPGSSGSVGLQAVKSAAPDGHTFALVFTSSVALNPLINKELGIDTIRDFVPVTNMFAMGVVLAVRDDFPAKDIRDLVATAKAKPESVRLGFIGAGNKVWIAQLEEATGAKFLTAQYKSTAELVQATLGGHIDVHFDTAATVMAQGGKLRLLSFGGPVRSAQFPNVPTIRELYKFDMEAWFGILAPAGSPPEAINWVSREVSRAMKDPKIVQLLTSNGMVSVASAPEEFAKKLHAEIEQNKQILHKYPDIR